jgi:nitrate reductase NapAB chaperone NapD
MDKTYNSLKDKYINQLTSKEKESNSNSNNSNIDILKNLDGIPRDVFINLLKEHGDVMDDKELSECLQVLRDDSNIKNLPDVISFNFLFNEILRFEEVREEEENMNTK